MWLRSFGRLLYTVLLLNCKKLENGHVQQIGKAMYKVAFMLWY